MKVISLKEPYATLIRDGIKRVETRSWSTKYRGVIYIHASLGFAQGVSEKTLNLVKDKNYNYGNIICKCKLVDCIYMTKEYVEERKANDYQEYLCGVYEEGRYAWVLEDIEVLDEPIKVKGQLGIWNYYRPEEIMNMMNDIQYASIDRKTMEIDIEAKMINYALMSPKEVLKYKVGVCWDIVELERFYFKSSGYNYKTYFMCYYDDEKCPTHTFLVYEDKGKFYWFEYSFEVFRGIHKYESISSLISDVRCRFKSFYDFKDYKDGCLIVYKYEKPKYGMNIDEFCSFCEKGEEI